MNNKGQAMIMGLVFLVMTLMIFTAFIPTINNMINDARDQSALNCASSKFICSQTVNDTTATGIWCYNSSKESETTSCLMFDIYLPYIVIAVLIGGVGLILGGKAMGMGQPQPQYGTY